MNERERTAAVRAIHDSPLRIVAAVTGGGIGALGDLLGMPGGSRTVLEATVPYSVRSLYELMGAELEPHVSDAAALAMADACLSRARHLAPEHQPDAEPWPLAGIACTAALATEPPRRGQDRAHVAAVAQGAQGAPGGARLVRKVTFEEVAAGDRAAQDRVTSDAVLELIAEIAEL